MLRPCQAGNDSLTRSCLMRSAGVANSETRLLAYRKAANRPLDVSVKGELEEILRNRDRCCPNSFGHANDAVMMEGLTNALLS